MASTKTNKGRRMISVERNYKHLEAKKMTVLGLALLNISETIAFGKKTLRNWKELDNWEDKKELNFILPPEIKKMILGYVLDVRDTLEHGITLSQLYLGFTKEYHENTKPIVGRKKCR